MAIPENHWNPDGSCNCPKTGKCLECGTPCNDHDLVADYYWCGPCINASLDRYEKEKQNEPI